MILQILNLTKPKYYSLIALENYILSQWFILNVINTVTVQVTEKF